MKYVLTEEQYLKTMDRIFNSLFNPIRYRTIRGHIHIFVGAKLIQKIVYTGNRYGKRTEIMIYLNHGVLEIDPLVYNRIIKVVPILEGNKLILNYFQNWFETRFGVRPRIVEIASRKIMDSLS
jgi:hypothetical protein